MDTTIDLADANLTRNGRLTAISEYHARKAFFDRCIAGILLVISAPVVLLLMFLVRATSSGPAIYKQTRVGKHGRRFFVYKIRTMYQDAEALHGPQWAVEGDPRVFPIGRILRFLHLDELPQLLNVVRGDMSLVGPRPERPEFVEKLALDVPSYRDRLTVLPGITGLAQINLPPDDSLASVVKKTIVDREYVANASAMLDLRILACTALRMLGIRHGRAAHWLRIEYQFPTVERSLEDTDADLGQFVEDTVVEYGSALVGKSTVSRRPPSQVQRDDAAFAYAVVPAARAHSSDPNEQPTLPRHPR